MRRNESKEFIGIESLKQHHRKQLDEFEEWARNAYWMRFHHAHYDWWMFPIDRPSTHGFKWVVYDGDVDELKKDTAFMTQFRRGLELSALAWGWNIADACEIDNPQPHQSWKNWPVRLFKMAQSAKLFGEGADFGSLKKYALLLMDRGNEMSYSGHDLSWLFTTGIEPKWQ